MWVYVSLGCMYQVIVSLGCMYQVIVSLGCMSAKLVCLSVCKVCLGIHRRLTDLQVIPTLFLQLPNIQIRCCQWQPCLHQPDTSIRQLHHLSLPTPSCSTQRVTLSRHRRLSDRCPEKAMIVTVGEFSHPPLVLMLGP